MLQLLLEYNKLYASRNGNIINWPIDLAQKLISTSTIVSRPARNYTLPLSSQGPMNCYLKCFKFINWATKCCFELIISQSTCSIFMNVASFNRLRNHCPDHNTCQSNVFFFSHAKTCYDLEVFKIQVKKTIKLRR